MNSKQAQHISDLLLEYSKLENPSFNISEILKEGSLKKFHQWANGNTQFGTFLIHDTVRSYWLSVINWNKPGSFHIVVFPENRSSPLLEIHNVSNENFIWKYSPAKQDGKNKDRKEYFKSQYGSLDAKIKYPETIEQIENFLTDIFSITELRIESDKSVTIEKEMNNKELLSLFKEYKKIDFYKTRLLQIEKFAPFAREIILETLKKDAFLKTDLDGFIQMLKAGTKTETFIKYLKQNIEDKNKQQIFETKFRQINITGYTGTGTAIIQTKLNNEQLNIIKTFLINVSKVENKEDGLKLYKEFKSSDIPYITEGIFSPWLYYLKPNIFPIKNSSISEFLKWNKCKDDYESIYNKFTEINKILDIQDFGIIDGFAHNFPMLMLKKKYNIIIQKYIDFCTNTNEWNEAYKWETVNFFQKNKEIEKINSTDFLNELYKTQQNLVNNLQFATIKKSVQFFNKDTKDIFINLFNETLSLKERYNNFYNSFSNLGKQLESKEDSSFSKPGVSEFAFFLTCMYPEKYFFYREGYYIPFAKFLNIKYPKKTDEKYIHYLKLMDVFKKYVLKNNEVQEITQKYLDKFSASKNLSTQLKLTQSKNILAQNIIYIVFKYLKEKEDKDKIYEEQLINKIKSLKDRAKVEKYFEILNSFVQKFNLKNDDKRISFSTQKDLGFLSVNIGQRYIIYFANNKKVEDIGEKLEYQLAFISREQDKEMQTNYNGFVHAGVFSGGKSTENIPDFVYYDMNKFAIDNDFYSVWHEAISDELNRTTKSGFNKHHNPLYFKAVIDKEYRKEILDKAFNTKQDNNAFWVFQASPNKGFDIFGALNDGILNTWSVNQFKNEIKKGDKIILRIAGERTGIYALATATSNVEKFKDVKPDANYYLNEEDNKLQDRVKLKLDYNLIHKPLNKEIMNELGLAGGSQGTNFKATKEQYKQILKIIKSNMEFPLNQILFGPPGTGKTYHTVNEAVKIVEELSDEAFNLKYGNNRKKLKETFKKYLEEQEAHIGFCTFHQSFSYEDFIEGIKPVMKNKSSETLALKNENIDAEKDLEYEIQDGIFKIISQTADSWNKQDEKNDINKILLSEEEIEKAIFYKMSLGNSTINEDDEIYDYCIKNNKIALGWGGNVNFEGIDKENEIIEKAKAEEIEGIPARTVAYFKLYLKTGNYVVISKGNTRIRAIAKVTGEYHFNENTPIEYNHFRNVEWLIKDVNIPVKDFYEKQFMQQTLYKLKNQYINPEFFNVSKEKTDNEEKKIIRRNHVLIIDEINRGNVSQIFGELITLIEKDKRKGKDEELSVTLPYSKTKFSVPPNLYIIGTMNTADRSIEALDTALRRRFTFKEMPPKADVIENEGVLKEQNGIFDGINLAKMLETINDRIEKLIDKDHKIGHSYLMNVSTIKELRISFKDKIIPLLEEYFYGDFGKIGLVLGNDFIVEQNQAKDFNFAPFNAYDNDIIDDFKQRKVYVFTKPNTWSAESFINIYKK